MRVISLVYSDENARGGATQTGGLAEASTAGVCPGGSNVVFTTRLAKGS